MEAGTQYPPRCAPACSSVATRRPPSVQNQAQVLFDLRALAGRRRRISRGEQDGIGPPMVCENIPRPRPSLPDGGGAQVPVERACASLAMDAVFEQPRPRRKAIRPGDKGRQLLMQLARIQPAPGVLVQERRDPIWAPFSSASGVSAIMASTAATQYPSRSEEMSAALLRHRMSTTSASLMRERRVMQSRTP